MSLSRAHELLAQHGWRSAPIDQVVAEALRPFPAAQEGRFSAGGPDVRLSTEAASALLLALYELGDNAQRYGAWSTSAGRVDCAWAVDQDQAAAFRLSWRESGGPAVAVPDKRGFGARLIEHGLARPPVGGARLDFAPGGVVFELTAPLSERIRLAG